MRFETLPATTGAWRVDPVVAVDGADSLDVDVEGAIGFDWLAIVTEFVPKSLFSIVT